MVIGAAGAAIAAAGISAAATVASSAMSSSEGEAGAAAAQAANDKLTAEQIRLAGQARDRANVYQSPYYNQGLAGQNKLSYLMGTSNIIDTPTDTSYDAYRVDMTNRKNQANINLQSVLKARPSPKNKKAFTQWKQQRNKAQQQLKSINANLTGGSSSTSFQKWQERMPGTIKTQLPMNENFGSLLADFDETKFRADPGYQFRKEQGDRELDRRLAGMGLASSGAALKEGMRFSQGLADQTYNDAFSRYNTEKMNKFNMLTSQSDNGQQAAGQMSQNENIYGSNVTGAKAAQNESTQNIIGQRANARASRWTGIGNAVSQGVNTGAGIYGQYKGQSLARA